MDKVDEPKQAEEVLAAPPKPQAPRTNPMIWYAAVVAIVLVATFAGFFAGVHVGGKSGTGSNRSMGNQGAAGMGRMGMMGAGIGTVAEVSETSISVETQAPPMGANSQSDNSSGQTKTYKISSDTKITDSGKTVAAVDIKSGDRVLVQASDSDESTASSIEINPQMRGGRGMTNQNDATPGANG